MDVAPVTQLILIRHAETQWNVEDRLTCQLDSPLTELGLWQTECVAKRMAKLPFDLLYTSGLGRTLTMAQAIGDQSGMPVHVHSELSEVSVGIFAGHSWDECKRLFPAEFTSYWAEIDYVVPGGESRKAYHERTVNCLNSLAQEHPGKRIVIVAHGGTFGVAFRHLVGHPVEAKTPARTPNAGISVFEIAPERWRLRSWGDTHHLDQIGSE